MRRKLITGIGVAALLLAGCSGGDDGGDDGDGPTKITFSHFAMTSPPFDSFLDIMDEFNASQDDYEISYVNVPFAGYHDTLFTQIGAGQGPTVVAASGGELPRAVEAGLAEDLTGKVTLPDDPSSIEQGLEVDGKRYAVVQGRNAYAMLINTTLLKEQGLEVPTTYDEFVEVAEKLTDAPNKYGFAFRHTTDDPNGWWVDLTNWVHGAGASWTDGTKPTIDTPEMAEGVQRMKDFLDEGLIPKGTDAPTYRRLFWEGKIPMVFEALAFSSIFAAQSEELAEGLEVHPLPMDDPSYVSSYEAAFVNANASEKEKEGGIAFINYMLQNDVQSQMVDSLGGQLPSSEVPFSETMFEGSPWLKVWDAEDSELTFYPDGVTVEYTAFRDAILAQIERIFADKVSVEEGLAQAQKDAEKALG